MQVKIKTKKGTVELSFRKLRIFHRLSGLEERMQEAEEQIKKLRAIAEACPYQHRAAEPVEGTADMPEGYNTDEVILCWTEGEDVANRQRNERLHAARKRGGSA